MATITDATGIRYVLPDASILSSNDASAILAEMRAKVIKAQDLDDVANYYRQWFGVNWPGRPAGAVITADDHNALRGAIVNGMGEAWAATLPPEVSSGNLIKGFVWGKPKSTFSGATYEFTVPGTYTVWAPPGAATLHLVQMIAGGGGGATGTEGGNGASGGSGGSGGYRSNEYYSITGGQWITVVVGAGGTGLRPFNSITSIPWNTGAWHEPNGTIWRRTPFSRSPPAGSYYVANCFLAEAGGDTSITINGTVLAQCTGGGPGSDYNYNGLDDYSWAGAGGYAGSPNGNPGHTGITGSGGNSSGNGVNGANSQLGTGGIAGGGGWPFASTATGYGAGGASGGWHDRTWPWIWPGTDGSGGYCKLELLPPT